VLYRIAHVREVAKLGDGMENTGGEVFDMGRKMIRRLNGVRYAFELQFLNPLAITSTFVIPHPLLGGAENSSIKD
jgi:hypothetical protein